MWNRQWVAYIAAAVLVPLLIGLATYVLLRTRTPVRAAIVISPDTTFLTGPLKADGTVDYAAALNLRYGNQATFQNNAAVLLWEIAHEEVSSQFEPRYRAALGMPLAPTPCELVSFHPGYPKSPYADVGDEKLKQQRLEAISRPWSESEFPEVFAWVAANRAPLLKAKEASLRSQYYSPIICDPDGDLYCTQVPAVQGAREIGRALVARAMLELAQGDFDAAWDDLLITLRLGRLLTRGAFLVEFVTGNAMERMAHAGLCQYLQVAPHTLASTRALREQLSKLPAADPALDKLQYGERVLFLEVLGDVANGSPLYTDWGGTQERFLNILRARRDINRALRIANKNYDEFLAIYQMSDLKQRARDGERFAQRLQAPLDEWKASEGLLSDYFLSQDPDVLLANFIFGACVPIRSSDRPLGLDAKQGWDLIDLGFRLAAYHAVHECYPHSLAALMQADSEPIPRDRFSLGDLFYSCQDGGYLLYSVGPDGQDDGGGDEDSTLRISLKKPPNHP